MGRPTAEITPNWLKGLKRSSVLSHLYDNTIVIVNAKDPTHISQCNFPLFLDFCHDQSSTFGICKITRLVYGNMALQCLKSNLIKSIWYKRNCMF